MNTSDNDKERDALYLYIATEEARLVASEEINHGDKQLWEEVWALSNENYAQAKALYIEMRLAQLRSFREKETRDSAKKFDSYNKKQQKESKDALFVLVAIAAFFLLAAFLGKNYNSEVVKFINIALVLGLIYALIKHTGATLLIMAVLVIIFVTGNVTKGCSRQSSYEYEPGPGFR